MLKLENYAIYHKDTVLIKPLTLHIPKAEFFAIIGESGSGKTLLTKAMLGLLPKQLTTAGKLYKLTDKIEIVVQQPFDSLQPNLSIKCQFHHLLQSHGIQDKLLREQKINQLLQLVGFNQPKKVLTKKTFALSGGMCQRVVIAMALFTQPELIILDEPTSALDQDSREIILQLLSKIHLKYKTTIVFVTHDLSIVYRFSTYVAIIKEGQLIETGTTKKVFLCPKAQYTKELIELFEDEIRNIKHRKLEQNI